MRSTGRVGSLLESVVVETNLAYLSMYSAMMDCDAGDRLSYLLPSCPRSLYCRADASLLPDLVRDAPEVAFELLPRSSTWAMRSMEVAVMCTNNNPPHPIGLEY